MTPCPICGAGRAEGYMFVRDSHAEWCERVRATLTPASQESIACGTYAAWFRHRRKGETPCLPCVLAAREYRRQWQAKRAARAS